MAWKQAQHPYACRVILFSYKLIVLPGQESYLSLIQGLGTYWWSVSAVLYFKLLLACFWLKS